MIRANRALCLFALLDVSLCIAGCGAGTAAIATSAGGGGGTSPSNTPTQTNLVGVFNRRESPARIDYLLTDPESDPAAVEVRFTTEVPPTFGGSTIIESSLGLATSPAGTQHSTSWDFASNFSAPLTEDVLVFVVVTGKTNIDLGVNATFVSVGNEPPILTMQAGQFPTLAEEASGIMPVLFKLEDSSGDDVRVKIQFSTDFSSSTPTWTDARPAGIPATQATPEFAFNPVTAFPLGTNLIFAWDTAFVDPSPGPLPGDDDTQLPGQDIQVVLRVLATEIVAPSPDSNEVLSPSFRVDNNVPPSIGMDVVGFALNPDRSRGIPVPFVLDDPEGDAVQVVFQWREQTGSFPALPTTILQLQNLLADPVSRRAAQIATEAPRTFEGRVLNVTGADIARLPELATSAAILNTRTSDPIASIEGLELQILRTSHIPTAMSPSWVVANPLTAPVASVPAESGHVLVLDQAGPGQWRLRDLDPSTGAVGLPITGVHQGLPTAMSRVPGSANILVASQIGVLWTLTLVDPLSNTASDIFTSDAGLAAAPVRGALGLRANRCLVTADRALIQVSFPSGAAASAATLLDLSSSSPLSSLHGLASDPLDDQIVYIADTGTDRVLQFDLSTLSLSRIRTPTPGTPRPTALAFESPGNRLLVLTDLSTGDSTRELRAFKLGLHRVTGASNLDALVLSSTLPNSVSALATGADGLRVLTSTPANELFVGGGVEQVRTISGYTPLTQEVQVDTAFQPAIGPGSVWRIVDRATRIPVGGADSNFTFVWDSLNVAGTVNIELRAVAFDKDLGPLAPSSPKTLRGAFNTTGVNIPNCCGGIACNVDGDGDIDFVSAGSTRLQTSPLGFTTVVNSVPGIDIVKDINLDGLLDIAFDRRVFLQNSASAATFLAGTTVVPGGVGDFSDAGDVDCNGFVDLLLWDGRIFYQSSLGSFSAGPGAPGFFEAPRPILRDFDGDCDLDTIGAESTGTSVEKDINVYEQLATGTFATAPVTLMPGLVFPNDIEMHDFDRDGFGDLVVALDFDTIDNIFGGTKVLFSSNPTLVTLAPPVGADGVLDIESADLDSDGLRDVMIRSTGPISEVGYQTSPGTLTNDSRGALSILTSSVADITGNGSYDLVGSQVLFSRAAGTFLDPSPANFGSAFINFDDCTLGDFTRDGLVDLFGVDRQIGMMHLFPQLRPGEFSSVATITFAPDDNNPERVRAGDVNGDGFNDAIIVMGCFGFIQIIAPGFEQLSTSGAVSIVDIQPVALSGNTGLDIVLLEPDDCFNPPGTIRSYRKPDDIFDVAFGITSFEVADADNDGDYDIIAGNDSNNVVRLRQGPIDTFTSSVIIPGDAGAVLAAEDLDHDGRIDIVMSGGSTTRIYLQQPAGNFILASPTIGFSATRAVPSNVDGDSFKDLVLFTLTGTRVAFQTLPGRFVEDPSLATSGVFANTVLDMDGDGELDAAAVAGTTINVRFGGR